MKACIETTGVFCYREKSLGLIRTKQNEKSTQGCERKIWIRGLAAITIMGKGVIRESDYKNHRTFTLKCISKDLVLVSVKLKSYGSKLSQGARKK